MIPSKEALENTVEKGENAGNHNFLFFPTVFQLYQRQKSSLQQYFICRRQILSVKSHLKICRLGKSLI